MPLIELSAGPIEYEDTDPGGALPVLVFGHGLLMDSTMWRKVVPGLQDDYRCITPTFPLGGHKHPMKPDADLAMRGQLRIVEEFLERLELHDVTLIFSDWGGQPLISEGRAGRVARLVLCSCEAFDNYPPGLPGRVAAASGLLPGGINAAMQPLRIRALRRLPLTFGWMSKRPVPDEIMDGWLRPAQTQKAIRKDLRKYVNDVPSKGEFLDWAAKLTEFTGPVLVAWAKEDKMMPLDHGPRLAELFPGGRLVEIPDSRTLISEDNPDALVAAMRPFLAETA